MYTDIKTWEDVCKVNGDDPSKLPIVDHLPEDMRSFQIAVYKIARMVKAVNYEPTGETFPDYTKPNQQKWFPWPGVKADKERPAGFGFSASDYRYELSVTSVGSRLCYRDYERFAYAFEQFNDWYIDLLTGI